MVPARRERFWRRFPRFLRREVSADVEDELRFHLEMRAREYEARGLGPDEAHHAAMEHFGDVASIRRWLQHHDIHRERVELRTERLSMLLQHLRYGIRSLAKQPAFVVTVVLSLALGIGATTAVFGIVHGVLLAPLPYPDPDRLVALPVLPSGTSGVRGQARATYLAYRRFNNVLSDVGAHIEAAVNLSDGVTPEQVLADSATPSVFAVLRVAPLRGRVFSDAEGMPGHANTVLISERLWRRRFQGADDIVGRRLTIQGVTHEVIGVLPERMRFPREDTQLWLPLSMETPDPVTVALNYQGVGRLRPGVAIETARTDLQGTFARIPSIVPMATASMSAQDWLNRSLLQAEVRPMRDEIVGDVGRVLWVILATVSFVLFATCANVANLCLVRTERRQREFAVHAALGARSIDVLVRLMVEALILASLGAGLGLGVAKIGLYLLRSAPAVPIPRLAEVQVDGTVLAATALIAVAVTLVCSALPMARLNIRHLASILRSGGRSATGGPDRRRLQKALVVTQMALAFMLVAASALLVRTFEELRRVRLGFAASHVLTFRVTLPDVAYRTPAAAQQFYQRLRDGIARYPGVESVGMTRWLPLDPSGTSYDGVLVEGAPGGVVGGLTTAPYVIATRGYLQGISIPVLAGQLPSDVAPGQLSYQIVVSSAFARAAWTGVTNADILGRRLRVGPTEPWLTVVGVVGDVHQTSLVRDPPPLLYLPIGSGAYGPAWPYVPHNVSIVVRTTDDPMSMAPLVRKELGAIDPALPVFDLKSMQAVVNGSMARTSFAALLLSIAAGIGLALAAVGLYGVVAYNVGTRSREIGVRIALGARPAALRHALTRQGASLGALGIAIGLLGALSASQLLRALLYGVSATDPFMYGAAAAVLLGVVLIASWIPARRASRVDPLIALRNE